MLYATRHNVLHYGTATVAGCTKPKIPTYHEHPLALPLLLSRLLHPNVDGNVADARKSADVSTRTVSPYELTPPLDPSTLAALPPLARPRHITFCIKVTPNTGLAGVHVLVAGAPQLQFITHHVPPAYLVFRLPRGYPETTAPDLRIECTWAPRGVLRRLGLESVTDVWVEGAAGAVCYDVTEHVRERLLPAIGAAEGDGSIRLDLFAVEAADANADVDGDVDDEGSFSQDGDVSDAALETATNKGPVQLQDSRSTAAGGQRPNAPSRATSPSTPVLPRLAVRVPPPTHVD